MEQVDRTEVVQSSLHLVFSKVFTLEYYFEEVQKLRFEVYDTHGPSSLSYQDGDLLGGMEYTLGQIVAQKKVTRALFLKFSRNAGKSPITVIAGDISGNNGHVELSLHARKLDDKDLFSEPDPFLELYRIHDDQRELLAYRTEVVKNDLSPTWQPFKASLSSLCSCELRPLKCLVWDYDSRGKHDFIGEFSTTFAEMQNAFGEDQAQWDYVSLKYTQKKHSSKNLGVVILADLKVGLGPACSPSPPQWVEGVLPPQLCRESQEPQRSRPEALASVFPGCGCRTFYRVYSFRDCLMGGCQIHFTVAVDFTASTGDPRNSCSLHYINPFQPHESQALAAVGETCQDYDNCASPPPPRLCEECGSAPAGPEMGGPLPAVSPAVRHPLILTDGVVANTADTREAIVRASHLPVSIIVGMGNADFTDMQALDRDDGVLRSPGGEPALRDILQFVPLRELKSASPAALAKSVLAEALRQLVEYYSHKVPLRDLGETSPGSAPLREDTRGDNGYRHGNLATTEFQKGRYWSLRGCEDTQEAAPPSTSGRQQGCRAAVMWSRAARASVSSSPAAESCGSGSPSQRQKALDSSWARLRGEASGGWPAGAGGGASVPCHLKILAQKDGKYSQFTDKKSKAQNS
ncbi:LOW QUALITY PROTEIN: copine-7 [Megaptera novaeangliae]